ncbi:MAG: metallophosphoesterase [Clostridia bacterium]|nr:metallophosphoesterase [Clostridia bacterium]
MKIFAISDLHMSIANPKPMDIFGARWANYLDKIKEDWKSKVTEEDIVLIAGDISWAMTTEDALKDFEYFKDLPGKKVFVRGNHDYWWKSITRLRDEVPQNCYMLQNDAIKFGNVVICGSRAWLTPGSPDFSKADEKIYLRETERLKMAFWRANELKEEGDKLICMVHFPPFNVRREDNEITSLIEKHSTTCVVYGHLHGKDSRADRLYVKNGIPYYLTSCDQVDNKLVLIDAVLEEN